MRVSHVVILISCNSAVLLNCITKPSTVWVQGMRVNCAFTAEAWGLLLIVSVLALVIYLLQIAAFSAGEALAKIFNGALESLIFFSDSGRHGGCGTVVVIDFGDQLRDEVGLGEGFLIVNEQRFGVVA